MITAELIQGMPLFAGVPMHELHAIAEQAADVDLRRGDWLVSEGEAPAFFGLISGRLEVLKGVGHEQHQITTYPPGETFGEVPLLLDSPAVASVRALEPSRVFRLDATDFRTLILDCTELNARVVATMSRRIADLQKVAIEATKAEVTIVGRRMDLDCHAVRDFLLRNHISFVWLDPDDDFARGRIPDDLRDAPTYPILITLDGKHLVAPTTREVAEAVNLQTAPAHDTCDLAIVGAGPAGLAAAVYGASEGLHTILFEREAPGGQAGTSSRIENYLGFPTGLSGDDLGKRALRQASRFGAEIVVARNVIRIEPGQTAGDPHGVILEDGSRVSARAVIIATGVAWRTLDAPGIADFSGRGVYYGAARTEALGTRGKRVHLVGGGNSAGQAAMYFSSYAESVTILVRGDGLASTMSQYLVDELATKANVTIEPHSEIARAHGEDHLASLEIRHPKTGDVRTVDSDALFIFIGADAETAWLPDDVIRDKGGFVCTGRDVMDLVAGNCGTWPLDRDPFLLETSVPGIFAAGDVRHGSIKRVASSVGEGSMTVAFVHQYLLNPRVAQPA